VGNEKTDLAPQNRTRYFSDIFFIYSKGKFSANGCAYYGIQQRETATSKSSAAWWQANVVGKYAFTDKVSLSGRVEYFDDPKSVQINPINLVSGFNSYSAGLCVNLQIASNVMARFEGRSFFSDKEVYQRDNSPVKNSNLLISNLTIWF
jgi:hypothetical protein